MAMLLCLRLLGLACGATVVPQPERGTGLPGDRLPRLRRLLESASHTGRPLRIMETHSGLSGLVVENARVTRRGDTDADGETEVEFDGMWSSSLTASAVRGLPDIETVDTTARLALVQETLAVTTKPLIYDADTGGQPELFRHTVLGVGVGVGVGVG
jgi:phosphoenolpyruvate phosphomutase